MKKLFGQMAADKRWQARGKTSRQCECEKSFCCIAELKNKKTMRVSGFVTRHAVRKVGETDQMK